MDIPKDRTVIATNVIQRDRIGAEIYRNMSSMRALILPVLFFLASCGGQSVEKNNGFKRLLPDTTKSWSGKMTRDTYNSTRRLEEKLYLESILNGTKNQEIRVWNLSGSYDPQVLFILKKDSGDWWRLRTLSFYQTKADSIYADHTRSIPTGSIDSLHLNRYWVLASQSDLKAGDSFGCLDGGDAFMEMADSVKYRFLWYRCPDINKLKDSAFFLVSELTSKLDRLQ